MTGENVFLFQEAVDDAHVTDLCRRSRILEDDFASAALSTVLVDVGSQLIFEMHDTVMIIQ